MVEEEKIEILEKRIEGLEIDKKNRKKSGIKESLSLYLCWTFAGGVWAIPSFIIYNAGGLNKIGLIGNVIMYSFLGLFASIVLKDNKII